MQRIIRPLAHLILASALLFLIGCGSNDETPTGPDTPPAIDIGATWRLTESGISNTIRGLAANDTLMVAVGDGGIIYSSTDGQTWDVQREFGPNDNLTDVVWADTQFVAVGFNGTIITSSDGINWLHYGPGLGVNFTGVAASDTMTVAVGSDHKIYTNSDVNTWVPRYTGDPGEFNDIVYAHEVWTVCGSDGALLFSADGIIWSEVITDFPAVQVFTALAVNDTGYCAIALIDETSIDPERCIVYRSSDGQIWHSVIPIEAWYIRDLTWTGTEWVAVGDGNDYHLGRPDGVVFGSGDGITWGARSTDAPFALNAATTFGGDLVVAGGEGYVLSGTESHYLTVATSGAELTGAVWSGVGFVAVTGRGTTMFSPEGESWTEFHSGVSTNFSHLAWSGSEYVTLGGIGVPTDIYTSSDGSDWTLTQAYDGIILNDVIWGGDRFVACGREGVVYISPDGASWTRQNVGEDVILNAAGWDGTHFLAASNDLIYKSLDGAVWTKPTVDPAAQVPILKRFVWTGSQYVAIGNDYNNPSDPQGWVYTSTDAVTWTSTSLGTLERLTDIAWTGRRYLVCGREGALLTSTNGSDWQVLESGAAVVLTDIAVGTDQAVVVGANRTVLVSP